MGATPLPFIMNTKTLDKEYPKAGYKCVIKAELAPANLAQLTRKLEEKTGKTYLVVKVGNSHTYLFYEPINETR